MNCCENDVVMKMNGLFFNPDSRRKLLIVCTLTTRKNIVSASRDLLIYLKPFVDNIKFFYLN